MKRKVGGVAYVAQRKNLDGKEVEQEVPPTIDDIKKLLSYLEEKNDVELNNPVLNSKKRDRADLDEACNEYGSSNSVSDNDKEMQKLIKRLVPYSKSLQGTAPHIAYERTKLMAMISSHTQRVGVRILLIL